MFLSAQEEHEVLSPWFLAVTISISILRPHVQCCRLAANIGEWMRISTQRSDANLRIRRYLLTDPIPGARNLAETLAYCAIQAPQPSGDCFLVSNTGYAV